MACFSCRTVNEIQETSQFESFLDFHKDCASPILTSLEVNLVPRTLKVTAREKLRDVVRLQELHNTPLPVNTRLAYRSRTVLVKGKVTRGLAPAKMDIRNFPDQAVKTFGRLSAEQTSRLISRFSGHLLEQASGCQEWGGPSSVRIYKEDGSTLATHSPQAIASFLKFGKAVSNDRLVRNCGNAACLKPEHLSLAPESPQEVPDISILTSFLGHSRPVEGRPGCAQVKDFSQSTTLRRASPAGLHSRTISDWKIAFFLAFGQLPEDQDRVKVLAKCGFLACVSPGHLELVSKPTALDKKLVERVLRDLQKHLESPTPESEMCIIAPDHAAANAAADFGALNFWSYWTPIAVDAQGKLSLDRFAAIAAISLEHSGWGILPAHLSRQDRKNLQCPLNLGCINPLHVEEAMLAFSAQKSLGTKYVFDFHLRPMRRPDTFAR